MIDPWRDWDGAGVRAVRENLGERGRLLMHELVGIRGCGGWFGVDRCLNETAKAHGEKHGTR